MEDGFEKKVPLLKDYQEQLDLVTRTGTVWTASAHIITAVIGSGVLSLAWSVAQLGWIAGPATILFFAAVTIIQNRLLSDCYRSPDPEYGPIRNQTYLDAVKYNLGEPSVWVVGFLQHVGLYGTGVVYTLTAAISMRAIQQSNCYHREGHDAQCSYDLTYFMFMFGAFEIVLSLIPDIHDLEWLSILSAAMSFFYSFIGFSLGFAKVVSNGTIKGNIRGVSMPSMYGKTLRIAQALGDTAYSFSYSIILLPIQDTLKSPPSENATMKKASMISTSITAIFYLGCGCFGYAAFGDDTHGNLLTGFGFYEPYWLIDIANICIFIHLLGGYQVMAQPLYQFSDKWFAKKFPDNKYVNKFYTIRLPFLPDYELNLVRLCYRTLHVISTTFIALIFPYFNQVLGLLGSFAFWHLNIYFPVEMYIIQRKIEAWSRKWILLQTFKFVCLFVCMFALAGSLQGLFSEKFR